MGLVGEGGGVAEHARQQPRDGLDDRQDGDLAAEEDVVADGDLGDLHVLGGVVDHALVDALVAAAREHQPRLGRQFAGHRLRERPPGRAGDQQARTGPAGPVEDELVEALAPRLRLHDHARAAAGRAAVDRVVDVVGPAPQVVDVEVEQAPVAGPADQGELQGLEVLGEDGDDVDAHHSSSRPGGGSTAIVPASRSTPSIISSTNGMDSGCVPRRLTTSDS